MTKTEKTPNDCLECKHSGTVLCSLSLDQKILLPSNKKEVNLKRGETIFTEGTFPNSIFIIYKGKVKLSKLGDEGREQIIRFSKDGDIVGYRALLSEESYRATATALCDVSLCIIPRDDFLDILSSNQRFYKSIVKKLASDLRNAENIILSISQNTVKQRVAEALVLLYHEFGEKVNHSIDVKLTRKEIGNIVGATIETTIRTLSDLKKENVIEFDGKEIIVKDVNTLVHISNFH